MKSEEMAREYNGNANDARLTSSFALCCDDIWE